MDDHLVKKLRVLMSADFGPVDKLAEPRSKDIFQICVGRGGIRGTRVGPPLYEKYEEDALAGSNTTPRHRVIMPDSVGVSLRYLHYYHANPRSRQNRMHTRAGLP